jgi:hypothetical protein
MFGEPGAEIVFHYAYSAPSPAELKGRNLAGLDLASHGDLVKIETPRLSFTVSQVGLSTIVDITDCASWNLRKPQFTTTR